MDAQVLVLWLTDHIAPNGGLVPAIIDYLAVLVGAVGGATFACDRKLDVIGTVSLGLIAGYGGGVMRDLLLQDQGIYFTQHPYLVLATVALCILVFHSRRAFRNLHSAVFLLDTLSVGLFAASGASKAFSCGSGIVMAFILGAITAVGGGALRDVFVGEVPTIFKEGEFYAVAGLAGSVVYVLCAPIAGMDEVYALVLCIIATTGLRYLSVWFNWSTNADPHDLTDYMKRGERHAIDAVRWLYLRGRLPKPTRYAGIRRRKDDQ